MFDFVLKITTLLLRASPRRYPILKNQIGNMIFWIVCVYIYIFCYVHGEKTFRKVNCILIYLTSSNL
jgi:hypothetical protein